MTQHNTPRKLSMDALRVEARDNRAIMRSRISVNYGANTLRLIYANGHSAMVTNLLTRYTTHSSYVTLICKRRIKSKNRKTQLIGM
jgi:hypothetical protein